MTDIMLDLETFGTKPGCAILSIGAAVFDRSTGDTISTFYRTIRPESCTHVGLTADPETAIWWMEQSAEARAAAIASKQGTNLFKAAQEFAWWIEQWPAARIWAQGQDFDGPILAHAMKAVGVRVPWEFRHLRDTRTVYDAMAFDTKSITRSGTYHNALDDCLHQIRCLHAAMTPGVEAEGV